MERFKIDSSTEIVFDKENLKVIKNGEIQEEKSEGLYKYFSLTKYNLDSFENNYIYLSNPKDFNDPFDCNRNLIIEKQKEMEEWEYVEHLNNNTDIGISCFSENGMEPLLWSHYTNSYKGFCLKYKTQLLDSNNELIKLKKVIYSENPSPISIKSSLSKFYKFIIKLENWSYEKEWRLLFKEPSTVENKYYFDEGCIEEILIGYKILDYKNDEEEKLYRLFESIRKEKFKKIPIYVIGPHGTKLKLQKTPLKEGTLEDGFEMMRHTFNRLLKKDK